MAAHLGKAPVELPVLAQEHCINRRLHIVIDAACAGALEEGKSPVMGIEHHLLALTRIGTHEQHAAVTEPDMSHLHRDGDAIDEHDLMAPVELVSLARGKRQRHIGLSRHCSAFLAPALGIAPNRIVAAVIAGTTQLFVNPRQCQPFTAELRLVRQEKRIQLLAPWTDLRQWLVLALIVELCRP